MMQSSFLYWALALVALVAVGCSGKLDCRNKGQECGDGFDCQKDDTGKWECLPMKQVAVPDGAAAAPGEQPQAEGEKQDEERGVTCPYHLLCPADAVRCECSGSGQLMAIETDRDSDGAPDLDVRLTRDDRGLVTEIEIDEGADGSADEVHTYLYESLGNPLQHEVRRPKDGDAEGVRITYLYDGNAQLTTVQYDEKLDGEFDATCTYDPPCRPPIPNASCDPECGGEVPQSYVFTLPCVRHPKCTGRTVVCRCDAYGNLLQRVFDLDGDGQGDEEARFAYDREGKMLAAIVDEGVDGSEDVRHLYAYNEQGLPTVWDIFRKPEAESRQVRYVYAEGQLVSEELDQGRDGKVDRRCTYDPPCPPPIPNPACKPVCK